MHIDHFPDNADEKVKLMTYELYHLIEPLLRTGAFSDHQSAFEAIYESLDKATKQTNKDKL